MKKIISLLLLFIFSTTTTLFSTRSAIDILNENFSPEHDYTILPLEAAEELDLDRSITIIDRTITPLGLWGLKTLTYPTRSLKKIKNRQDALRGIHNNNGLYNELIESLGEIKNTSDQLLTYWNEDDVLNIEAKKMYFNILNASATPTENPSWLAKVNNYLNASPLMLECGPFLSTGLFTMQHVGMKTAENIGTEYLRGYETDKKITPASTMRWVFSGITKTAAAPIVAFLPTLYAFKQKYDKNELRFKPNLSLADQALDFKERLNWNPKFGYTTAVFSTVGLTGLFALAAHQQYQSIKDSLSIIDQLRARLTKIAHIIKEAEHLYKTCSEYPFLKDLPALQSLESFIHAQPQKLAAIIKLLHNQTFTGKESFFYRRGRVLFAHQAFSAIKEDFLPLLRAIGELDAHVSMAQLYKEHESKDNKYCFVDFDETTQFPKATLVNFWLPLVTQNKPVLNSLLIRQKQSLLLAGPNGGGKSTFMKAITYNWALLPLSWGMAAATRARVTLLTQVKTSINVQESLQAGESTFMAQKKRFDQILNLVKDQDQSDRTLLLIDEPLSGTVEAEAARRTVLLGKAIAQKPTICSVIATHLESPTHLDELTGAFKNYYPEVIEDAPGIFRQTYKLLPGKAEWWFNDADKRSRFIDWLSAQMSAQSRTTT